MIRHLFRLATVAALLALSIPAAPPARAVETGSYAMEVLVDGVPCGTYFARLHVRQDGRVVEIDSRPSDAIALGIAYNTPIFVVDWVLDIAAGGS